MAGQSLDPKVGEAFSGLLDDRLVEVVFQRLVNLQDNSVVGYEALARGPMGSSLETPEALFAAARAVDRVAELDWVCRAAAFEAAVNAQLPPALSVFVNVEPESLGVACPDDLAMAVTRAETQLRVFVEFNERALAADPAGLLATVARARESGWGVSLDDVGARLSSLSLLWLMRPDVVKLDLRLLRRQTPRHLSVVVNAVLAYRLDTDAAILAEGIETKDDRDLALTLGATFGSGFLLGSPGPLPDDTKPPLQAIPLAPAHELPSTTSPFDILQGRAKPHRMARSQLESISQLLTQRCQDLPEPPVLLAGLPSAIALDAPRRERLAALASHCAYTVAFGVGLPTEVAPGVVGIRVPPHDMLARQWLLVVLSPHFAVALLARACATGDPQTEQGPYDAVLTYDRQLVAETARNLLARVPAPNPDGRGFVHILAPPPTPADDPGPSDTGTAGDATNGGRRRWRDWLTSE